MRTAKCLNNQDYEELGGHSCPLLQGKRVTTYLEKFVTNSDSSTGCRALLRHTRDENTLEDKWGLVHKSTSRGRHLLLMGVEGAVATGQ